MSELLFFSSAILGLAVGSFLNVLIDRGYRKERINGRSRCEHCGKILSAKELIPVFSYLLQKGRCRQCGSALSIQYLLVELGCGLSLGLAAYMIFSSIGFGLFSWVSLLTAIIAISSSLVILVYDFRWQIIPDGALIFLLGAAIAASFLRITISSTSPFSPSLTSSPFSPFLLDFAAAVFFSLFLYALWFFSRGKWIGFGDVKLIFVTSLLAGFPRAIPAFLLGFWLGGIAGIILLILKRKGLRDEMPLGPFLLCGAVLSFFIPRSLFSLFTLI